MGKRGSSFLDNIEQNTALAKEAQQRPKPSQFAKKTSDTSDMPENNTLSKDTTEHLQSKQTDPNKYRRQWEYMVERHPIKSGEKKYDSSDRFTRLTSDVPNYHLSKEKRLEHDQWLNKLGEDGWELVNMRRTMPGESGEIIAEIEYIFKREV